VSTPAQCRVIFVDGADHAQVLNRSHAGSVIDPVDRGADDSGTLRRLVVISPATQASRLLRVSHRRLAPADHLAVLRRNGVRDRVRDLSGYFGYGFDVNRCRSSTKSSGDMRMIGATSHAVLFVRRGSFQPTGAFEIFPSTKPGNHLKNGASPNADISRRRKLAFCLAGSPRLKRGIGRFGCHGDADARTMRFTSGTARQRRSGSAHQARSERTHQRLDAISPHTATSIL